MAEALYRKYRPQTFEDVVGQTHIERTLKNAIESDKVSHAYLFCGPRGTGKTTTARLLAKALLCEHGPTPAPDGTCEQCLAVADGTHPDVSELDAASRTGVENVREEIIGRVQYAPTHGRYKIYIIDEVHMLSTAAFNALLKTLEEPPSHVVFILCTTDPQRVPETIHSRCQRFDFHRLSNEEIVSRLGAVCVAEGVEFEGDALDLVAHRAQGGMRDALTALEQLIAFGGGKVTVEVAQSVLGSIDADDMSTVVSSIAARDAAACFTWVSEYVETGADLARFARDLASYVRDLYVLELTDGAVALDAPQAERAGMAKQAKEFGADRLAYVLRVLGDLNTELRSAVNPRLSFEIALTRMVRPESDLTLEALAARVSALESALASGAALPTPAPAMPQQQSAPAAQQSASAPMPAAVPPVSSGYRSPAQRVASEQPSAPAPSEALTNAAAAMSKASAFRAQLEQRRAGRAAAQAPVAPPQAQAQPRPAVSTPAPASKASASAASASDEVKAKIADESALQRGWQAALAELKRERAAYGALMLSARVVAQPDAGSIAIEFARENSFAFAAAQKPDIASAIARALEASFGGPVPFVITQGDGAASVAKAALSRAAAVRSATAAVPTPAPTPAAVSPTFQAQRQTPSVPVATQPAPQPLEDDIVPYDDADVVPYGDADVESYSAPWDEPSEAPAAAPALQPAPPRVSVGQSEAPAFVEPAQAPVEAVAASVATERVSRARTNDTEPAASAEGGDAPDEPGAAASAPVLTVDGPEPLDPYVIGKKLGFDSMPTPKKRRKNSMVAQGWPGVGEPLAEEPQTAPETAEQSVEATPAEVAPVAPEPAPEPEPDPFAEMVRQTVVDRPNPFAGRQMPSGIGGAARPAAPAPELQPHPAGGEEMPVADIFGSFGISMDQVQEEHDR